MVVYIVLMLLCYRLRVVPYALPSVCYNLFYCLVKYIWANVRDILGVVKLHQGVAFFGLNYTFVLFSGIKAPIFWRNF